ncbi:hypothetical protein M5U04_06680 [Xenorhabdus sp. XENO-1]|uniref:RHS repeat-associated core domain-containing protein n=1 Tax=Xenorhabdus bovienii TaxID=40576 RepID=UPI0020CA7780|nr:RHS repeat-associated core domain-containing protein [Xenorhabdus bovienii]MCP9267795.1 hypothetical protein [Xenorhabdus bovienii subsp. africana]
MALQLTANDINGSTLFSLTEGTLSSFHYDPFGATAQRSGISTSLPGFNGERSDPLTNVTHLGNGYRAYSSMLYRFTCPDSESPFGVGGINPYVYCSSDPVNMTDPNGHGPITWLARQVVRLVVHVGLKGTMAEALPATMATSSAVEAATTLVDLASTATGIASNQLEKKNPEKSQKLAWASMGLGMGSAVHDVVSMGGHISKGLKRLTGRSGSYSVSKAAARGSAHAEGYGQFINRLGRGLTGNAHGRNPGRHPVSLRSKVAYDSEQGTYGGNIKEPPSKMNARASLRGLKPRTTVIHSGSHGTATGNNGLVNDLHTPRLIEGSFYRENAAAYKKSRIPFIRRAVKIVDSNGLVDTDYNQYSQNPKYHVIGGYCYNRNDEALRFHLNVLPVTSYGDITQGGIDQNGFWIG